MTGMLVVSPDFFVGFFSKRSLRYHTVERFIKRCISAPVVGKDGDTMMAAVVAAI
jgi:hypothetical protein